MFKFTLGFFVGTAAGSIATGALGILMAAAYSASTTVSPDMGMDLPGDEDGSEETNDNVISGEVVQ